MNSADAPPAASRWALVVEQDGREVRQLLPSGAPVLVGSGEAVVLEGGIHLDHATVSRRHATFQAKGSSVAVCDLGSSNGTVVDGDRIEPGAERSIGDRCRLHFGTLACRLERVAARDAVAAVDLGATATVDAVAVSDGAVAVSEEGAITSRQTLSVGSVRDFLAVELPALMTRLEAAEGDHDRGLRAAGRALFHAFPCRELTLLERGPGDAAVRFHASAAQAGTGPSATDGPVDGSDEPSVDEPVEVTVGSVCARITFTPGLHVTNLLPLVELVLRLVRLTDRPSPLRGASARPLAAPAPRPPLPEPASVDAAMVRLYDQAGRMARGNLSILIEGETGTGKEVLARYVHCASARPESAWVALNCAALPQDLLEAELFGIEKGVATGVEARPGCFEQAHGGSLFLDEIGDMAPATQAKILRILEGGEVFRLGARASRQARVRVIAATNQDMKSLVSAGSFRLDLYHRIADCRLRLPPLRERLADLPSLAGHFLSRAGAEAGVAVRGISQAALDILLKHDWPGNVRQLEREMTRAVHLLQDGELLQARHLDADLTGRMSPDGKMSGGPQPGRSMKAQLDDLERRILVDALARHEGRVRAVGEELGMSRTTLYRRFGELGIEI